MADVYEFDKAERLKAEHDTLMEENKNRELALQKHGIHLKPMMIAMRRLSLFIQWRLTEVEKWEFELLIQKDLKELLEKIDEERKEEDHGGLVVPGQGEIDVEKLQAELDEMKYGSRIGGSRQDGLNRQQRRQQERDRRKGRV